ncbi:MAG: hypothetical protein ACD_57C00262G0004 [uncultured bacterium]|uniref:Uncharacterized protein n=1 Tax=Candidatus Woesebacteria bacterium RIFCSPHIGHO2_12_FULL_41_24 TaxID=1802510 RepID=A0A1F8AVV3_9BACT|nr:MAG: hypothetical protein ACD_57C00262G0004 [uncultured bacterium]OGM14383.1 MAG: hypothetical protein A2W15_02430 [Candidatus Woesebacteria bacterium RBG_16_41_13]OGM30756.1 MAG: hypothetical protein A2873_03400 [Candidatus Woesebacteria bacterium RIFCSPHIGHO2_01_FULL_42_80]OGM34178.1 MAG: hypothetical protein A3D84_04170 [Candidatus Woesebacteria bacterium RIFCSPHIGHO2_02_FULL_42_20]OGM55365.1 MAG: hypothetical protein A3E44_03725 [Candidatus Woesebacteria bacterium RIFCSPHIGHO2_12_FULL_41
MSRETPSGVQRPVLGKKYFSYHFIQWKISQVPTNNPFLTDSLREPSVGIPCNATRILDDMQCVKRQGTATPTNNTIIWKRAFNPQTDGTGNCDGCPMLGKKSGCIIYDAS